MDIVENYSPEPDSNFLVTLGDGDTFQFLHSQWVRKPKTAGPALPAPPADCDYVVELGDGTQIGRSADGWWVKPPTTMTNPTDAGRRT